MLYGYTRCSTQEQADGATLHEQERAIRGIAMIRNVDQYGLAFFSDPGVSGGLPLSRRPAGSEMLKALRAGDIIVVSKLDRLFRSVGDAIQVVEDLRTREVGLIIADMGTQPVTDSAASKMFFQLMSVVAEFERTRINERTAEGRRYKKKIGGCIGQAPFGYHKHGVGRLAVLEKDEREQAVLAAIRGAVASYPNWSAQNMARKDAGDELGYAVRYLRDHGHVDRAGHLFRRTQVKRLLDAYYQEKGKQLEAA